MNWKSIAEAPTTNVRILVSVFLAVLYVLGNMVGQIFFNPGRLIDESVGYFILAMMIPDVAQFAFKRNTYVPTPPNKPDIEDRASVKTEENLG